jgi:hypothetical protein
MYTSLIHDILVIQLKSNLKIEQARLVQQLDYSMNSQMIVESNVTKAVITEIKKQLKELKTIHAEDLLKK